MISYKRIIKVVGSSRRFVVSQKPYCISAEDMVKYKH